MSWMKNQELCPTATNMAQQPNGREPTYNIRLTPQEFMQFIQERLPTPIDYHSEIALRNLLDAHLADLRIIQTKKGTAPWLKDETPSPPPSPKRHPATSSKPPPGFKVSKAMKRGSIHGCTSFVTSTAASTLSTTSSFGSTSPRVTKPVHKKGGYFKGKKLGFVNGLNHNRSRSPNGPPVAVDQSFYFHHTHPLFRFLYPNDPRVRPLRWIEWPGTSDNGDNSNKVSSRIPALLPGSGNSTKANEPNKIATPKGFAVKIEGGNVKLEEADSDNERIKVKVEEVETDNEADVKTTVGEGPTDARKYGISSAHSINASKFARGATTTTAAAAAAWVAPMSSSTRNGTPVKTSQASPSLAHGTFFTVYVAPAFAQDDTQPSAGFTQDSIAAAGDGSAPTLPKESNVEPLSPASSNYGAEPSSSAFGEYNSEPSSQASRKRARDDDDEAVFRNADKRPVKAAKLTRRN